MRGGVTTCLAVAALLGGAGAGAAPLEDEATGRLLYLEGRSARGSDIVARFGPTGAVLPGSAVPCASCHGSDGRGRPEGAVIPPAITWAELAKPYGHVHEDGRRHGPFDEAALARALSDGIDPAGNPLQHTMPRYSLPRSEVRTLAAYLKVLGTELDPGVSATSVRIGVFVPAGEAENDVGSTVRATLEAYFSAVNERGGIHGRRIELSFSAAAGAPALVARDATVVPEPEALALIAGFAPDASARVAALAERSRIPAVDLLPPRAATASGTYVFHLTGGIREEARVLAEFSAEHVPRGPAALDAPGVAVVALDTPALLEAASAAEAQLRQRGVSPVRVERWSSDRAPDVLARELRDHATTQVLFLGDGASLESLIASAATLGWAPDMLASGALAVNGALRAPLEFRGRVFLAFPTSPRDGHPSILAELAALRRRSGIPDRHRPVQLAAHSAASLLAEGLRRVGRDPTREALTRTLERISSFESQLLPPLSYGPNRRIGNLGGYVVAVDPGKGFRPMSGWIALGEELR